MYSICSHAVLIHCTLTQGKREKIKQLKLKKSSLLRTMEAAALRGHFIALLWSSEVHRTQFHHNNGKEGRRDKRGLSLLLNPFAASRSVAYDTEPTASDASGEDSRATAHPAASTCLITAAPRYT
ncbi:hypothetical protein GOODEAATRI_028363 [Goodea atripinnis]|uniref:Uncharacterized protein n=1 Tax=Goodea atripinnis TaxID=208336 RepID=A0ABV0PSX4_9TELE